MNKSKPKTKPVVGLSIGDLNGVGPEIIIKALSDNRILKLITPVVYGSTKVLSYYRKSMNLEPFNHNPVNNSFDLHFKKINVVNCWSEAIELKPGEATPESGTCAFKALEKATADLKEGKIHALITAPINKKNIQSDDFNFPGHTEYITEKFEAKDSLMILASDRLKVGVVTGHMSLKEVPNALTKEKIINKASILLESMKKDFGAAKPRIAVLGLNPHAGEDGILGNEEQEVISPAIAELKKKGHLIFGPYPADGFFGTAQYEKFDATLAMYHDQGLVPFKTLSFEEGVNFTAGLSHVRTSPDHGTAYNIAGKNQANESSIRSAIFMAVDILNHRNELNPVSTN
ncbi:4-hydroxythreonine-4-phosphate dehydrogenase PdxA [Fulvivirgaceae bacterium BMA10]|uniref:4-hydroxythreonine-4-phosphate dehydrogenase PdxA n=1 Tax=Splendidivirga corallicola TaxID=3051826 RepID=A0ABT8KSG8_9BACT|nr:4-hydroxythreonine-4-phosphate dehydrogenase PdxA [Fulvivirgaceae bacterium BMA10]